MSTHDNVTGLTVEVDARSDIGPERVWDLVADVERVGEWSPECVAVRWLDGAGPVPGARFTGVNRRGADWTWTVTCQVVTAVRPERFGWVVLDDPNRPDVPSGSWDYLLEPLEGGGTLIRERFVHGPGNSGLRAMIAAHPDREAHLIRRRAEILAEHMRATLAAMLADRERVRREFS